MIYSDKQKHLLSLWQTDQLKRINLLEGSVRSGKTWISLVLWAFWVATMPKDKNYLMVAKTLTSLRRNCLDLLQELVGAKNFTYSLSRKEASLFGRLVYLEGVNDARSESKIRGMTLQGAYCDELTLFTEDFFSMLLSRLSESGAKLISTTNPDNPNHWLKTKYMDRRNELDMLVLKFLIDDNPYLDADYVTQLKKEYTGVFHDRFIKGLWKAAEGAIYIDFANDKDRFVIDSINPEEIEFATIGVDFGGNGSAHAFNLTGYTRGFKKVITLEEYYKKEIITPEKLCNDFCDFVLMCASKYKVIGVYADSAEQVLIQGLREAACRAKIPIEISNARKGEIVNRIRFYNLLMSSDRYKILSKCKHTIEAFSSAVWDSKHKTEDVRLDDGTINIDNLDAQEYSTEPFMDTIIKMRGAKA